MRFLLLYLTQAYRMSSINTAWRTKGILEYCLICLILQPSVWCIMKLRGGVRCLKLDELIRSSQSIFLSLPRIAEICKTPTTATNIQLINQSLNSEFHKYVSSCADTRRQRSKKEVSEYELWCLICIPSTRALCLNFDQSQSDIPSFTHPGFQINSKKQMNQFDA